MGQLPPNSDDRLIWDLWEAQFRLPVMTAADETGVFAQLAHSAASTPELAQALELDTHALGILLAALASSGLIEKRLDRWYALADARRWLHPDATGYWGGFLHRLKAGNPIHDRLVSALQTGTRPDDAPSNAPDWEHGQMSAEAARSIAAFMHAHSQAPALGMAEQPLFGELDSLLDVGCGSGVYGITIADRHPQLRVGLMDLAAMASEAGSYADRAGMADRIVTHPANMFTDEWPQGYTAHFFSNIFHDWSPDTNSLTAARSFAALPSGGRILLNEILMDDDLAGPWHAAAFSVMMLLSTQGKQYSLPELRDILESAGFVRVQAQRTGGGYYSLVSAEKP